MNRVAIGQYYPVDSPVHRMDPRAKWLFLFAFMLLVFFADDGSAYMLLFIFVGGAVWVARVPWMVFVQAIRPVSLIILFTFLLHLATTKGGAPLLRLPFVTVYEEGFRQAVFVSMRLFLLVAIASLLTFTTSPLDLTDGLERLFQPLRRLGVPVHEIALMMSIALRFIPTLWEEADKIRKAQMARGVDFASGSILKRIYNHIPILIPLFLSSFRRAEELALAIEARCYRGGKGRTKWRELRFSGLDGWLLLAAVFLFVALWWLRK